ncbi:alanine racemase [Kaistella jeonii]|uniref:Amino acid racemase n=1 Tax=Kaistella jeonii TaxID=266749 RepID=A0A0C1FS12_9FLAO|nr:alanine/ornithine racemase family PLP-dependent enzyme [Kaistella jeonii]KIA90694.1 amino acid racemase [Kaistella jeonii]SFB68989.1 Predicted amino acid racemase [Kaistella jeonii]VEI94695.1 alanine racemase [Kaistella jeonii]
MSYITLHATKLRHNFKVLDQVFAQNKIEWAIVAKLLCGNEKFLKVLLNLSDKEICDSRLSNLKTIKKLSPKTQTIYIKPPAKRLAKSIVEFADVSFNTELATLELLSEEAVKQNKIHKVVLMVEMGELREGIMVRNLMHFYDEVIALSNIEVVGLGTNLNCLNGILPDERKLYKLNRFKEIIEENSGETIPYISGGSSVTIPLIFKNEIPFGINHFRIGETLFFGTNVYEDSLIAGMYQDVFTLTAEIIEMQEKPTIPSGLSGTNLTGETPIFSDDEKGKFSLRAIVDVGLLDIDHKDISTIIPGIEIIGASSDMLILDLGENSENLEVGDTINFSMNYMAVLRAMNSDYVDKKVETEMVPFEIGTNEYLCLN